MIRFADKQTLEDLNLTGKYKPGSIFSLFNKVQTNGGERLLEEMFHTPFTQAEDMNHRSAILRWFAGAGYVFPFTREAFGRVEDYLGGGGPSSWMGAFALVARRRVLAAAIRDEGFAQLRDGVTGTLSFLRECRRFLERFDTKDEGNSYLPSILDARGILHDTRLSSILRYEGTLSLVQLASAHHLLTYVLREEMAQLCGVLHHLDVYIAVGKTAVDRGLAFAQAMPEEEYIFHAADLRHPGLDKAVGNPVTLDRYSNVLFLTGANMAGKSTLMKSLGIALYLGHMGFPVAAAEMVFSVREGLYSSINVPDDLAMGYSHFYAEVQRVKAVAAEVSASRSLVVIFDELFKGTNVKDAYEATLSVTAAFAEYRNCLFVVSTHIIEVGEALRAACDNVLFHYMPTIMEGRTARYPYKMAEGITTDRHGMMIIEQEGVLEMIGRGAPEASRMGE